MIVMEFVLLFVFVLADNTVPKNAAVIFSGKEFHHEGLALEQALLKKNYDVHLVQVKPKRSPYITINNWSKSKLEKQLTDYYSKLIFIVTAHGVPQYAANIQWDCLLKLVKFLETKANELYIHLETCHSGGIADTWMNAFGNNVKIFATSSCKNKSSVFDLRYIDHTNLLQIFTGYYLNAYDKRIGNPSPTKFKTLHFNSSVGDLLTLFDKNCEITQCSKVHIHKGNDEKIKDWKLLPKHLTIKESSSENGIDFPNYASISTTQKQPNKKEVVMFSEALHLTELVNVDDPIDAWKIRTVDVEFTEKAYLVPNELKKQNISSYSSILSINSNFAACNTQRKTCTKKNQVIALETVRSLSIAHYENKNQVLILEEGDKEKNYFYYILIGSCIAGALLINVAICCRCCRKTKLRKQEVQSKKKKHVQEMQQNIKSVKKRVQEIEQKV